jgi:beta-lactam-binding protein with PASTA domain
MVAVPRVVGKSESSAQDALSAVGLTASFVGEPVNADIPTCRVKSQPSKPVPPDTDVMLSVRCKNLPPPQPPEP